MDAYQDERRTIPALLKPALDIAERFGIPVAFFKFILVGGVAFIVNQIALYVLYDSPVADLLPGKDAEVDLGFVAHPDARLLIASVLAVEVAIIFKFFFSEGWIFSDRPQKGSVLGRFLHFNMSAAASAVLTISVTNVLTPVFGITPYVTTAIGVLAGFMLNWIWSARLVWPERRAAEAVD